MHNNSVILKLFYFYAIRNYYSLRHIDSMPVTPFSQATGKNKERKKDTIMILNPI